MSDGSRSPSHTVRSTAVLDWLTSVATAAIGVAIPVDEDMFNYGLDSMAILTICAVVEDELAVECYPLDLFENSVLRELARVLNDRLISE